MKIKFTFIQFSVILISLPFISNTKAQEFIWDAGFNGFFDNREYYNDYTSPYTVSGSRAFAAIGISLHENYSISAGFNALYEFGSSVDQIDVSPIIYFKFKKDPVLFFLGSFNRKNIVDMPDVFQIDTLQYFRPNIEGIFLEFKKNWGSQNVWLDWTSKKSPTDRESLNIGGTGKLYYSSFFFRWDFIMTHYALPEFFPPEYNIRDNGGIFAKLGVFDKRKNIFDSLSFSTGVIMSYDRVKNEHDFYIRNGSISELFVQYKGVGIKSIVYFGEGQIQMQGDPLYLASFYNRNDFFWKIFRKDNIEGKAEFSLHIIEKVVDVSQSLTLYVNVGGTKALKPEKN